MNRPRSDAPGKDPKLLFGNIAVKHGFVTEKQIDQARQIQKQAIAAGQTPKKLGAMLVEMGFITNEQVEEIYRLQGREGGHQDIAGYELLERIGQGAMGLVFRARQISMDRIVAIKVLYPKLAKNQSFVERFITEARASAKLNHANIITGIDVGESNGIYYFAMEFVDGHTVSKLLKRGGALDEKRAITITLQIAKALDHAFRHGIVHRDIKPDNIMLGADGAAKLCDLGLAKIEKEAKEEVGTTLGTPNYISPEQARGEPSIDIRSDIYSLGGTLFHMLSGRRPYEGTVGVVISKHCNEAPPDPRQLMPDVSARSAFISMKMMAKRREERYQTPKDLIKDLEIALQRLQQDAAGPAPAAPPPPRPGSAVAAPPPPPSGSQVAAGPPGSGTRPPLANRRRGALRRRIRRK